MTSNPVRIRRIESAFVLAAALIIYQSLGYSWPLFAALFFVPDLSIIVYRFSKTAGGIAYNSSHCFCWPIALCLYSLYQPNETIQAIAIIWLAHCAFDRAIGWGLKYSKGFCNTDMGLKSLPIDNIYLR